jgi:xanthine dehydrogenase accessory factor
VKRALFDQLRRARADKRAVVVATELGSGAQRLLDPTDGARPDDVPEPLWQAARDAIARDRSGVHDPDGAATFLRVYNPPLRLIIVGAVHIAQALAAIMARLEFDVTVVDPRAAFATEARFGGVRRVVAWPAEAFDDLTPDPRTAIVTLTHDPKIDEPALVEALRSQAFYIGALGSTRTQAARLRRLREHGFDDATLARIHGPVGLPIGASSAAEIALSIAAQIIERLRT